MCQHGVHSDRFNFPTIALLGKLHKKYMHRIITSLGKLPLETPFYIYIQNTFLKVANDNIVV
jgi:hypothetical protein